MANLRSFNVVSFCSSAAKKSARNNKSLKTIFSGLSEVAQQKHGKLKKNAAILRNGTKVVRCEASTNDVEASLDLDLGDEFCDDFVCNSSPSLEPTIRTLVADAKRNVDIRTLRCYVEQVQYKDSMRSFTGRARYERMKPIAETLPECKAVEVEVDVAELDTVVMSYKLQGSTPVGRLDMDFKETFVMNMITGRVEEHKVSWENGRSDASAVAFFTSTRAAYCATQSLTDLNEGLDNMIEQQTQDSIDYSSDPMDPMKFFQQEDTRMNDMFVFAAGVTFLYAAVQLAIMFG